MAQQTTMESLFRELAASLGISPTEDPYTGDLSFGPNDRIALALMLAVQQLGGIAAAILRLVRAVETVAALSEPVPTVEDPKP